MSILYAMLLQAWSTIKAYPGQWLQPIVFSTLIILLLTFGSDPTALRTGWGPSAIWVACLLSLWYTTEQWFHRALDEGTLEPWLSSPIPLAYLLALQTGILWVIYALPLVLLSQSGVCCWACRPTIGCLWESP